MKIDLDGSGFLSLEEFRRGYESFFSNIDVEAEFEKMDLDKVLITENFLFYCYEYERIR